MRLFLWMALVWLLSAPAFAGTATITTNDSSGNPHTFQVITNGSGYYSAQNVICDGTATAQCAAVKPASTAAVATDPALVVSVSPNNSVAVTGTFFQTTQPISAAALPLPTGAATQTTLAAVLTALGSPMQNSGGSVTANAGTNLNTSALATQTTLAAVLSALGSPFQASGSIGNTAFGSTQVTSPWVIGGPAAAGAAPVGNPLFTGMFDGTDIRRVMGDETNGLWVNIKAGAGSGGTALADEATFTQGSTNTTPLGCFYTTSVTNLTTGQAGVARCTNDRQQMVADAAVLAQLVTLNNTATLPVPFPVNITPTDCSGTATGTAANAFTAGATKHGFFVSNRSTDPIWISFTGNAVVGGTASYLLPAGSSTVAGGSFSAPSGFGMNTALSVIGGGSSDAYTCTWY
jgi:hypothetical protein